MTCKIAHTFNFFKFRILDILYDAYLNPNRSNYMSTPEIAEAMHITPSAFHNVLPKATAYGMIIRTKRKVPKGKQHGAPYRYRISKYGIEIYLAYRKRIERGQTLSRLCPPKPVKLYFSVWGDEGETEEELNMVREKLREVENIILGDIKPASKDRLEEVNEVVTVQQG